MILGIHQLHYLPWLRYFDKIARSDIFVFLDNIQYSKNEFQNRNKIKTSSGWMYLTVPVFEKYQQNLDEVLINNNIRWKEKHLNALITNYNKSPYFKNYRFFFEEVYNKNWDKLNDINYEIILFLLKSLKIKTKIVRSSQLKIEGQKTERLVNICKMFNADTYLSGAFAGKAYLDEEKFRKERIKVIYQDWKAPVYSQLFPEAGFIPDLSIVDLLFNEGERSKDIILGK